MLYDRGVSDDKGPLLAALYAATRIGQEGHTPYHPIRLITGGAEETTWECMEYYFKHNPQSVPGFSPGDNFPIVNGEKGISQICSLLNTDSGISLHCKECLHIVCDSLWVITSKGSDVSFVKRTNLIEVMQDGIEITHRGVRTLSRNPQRGDDAIFKFVEDFHGHPDQTGSLYSTVNMIYENFLDGLYDKKSGLHHEDAAMGCGPVCLTSLNMQDGQLELCVDVCCVRSTGEQSLFHILRKATRHYGCEPEALRHKRLFYIVEDSTLIQSLKTAHHRVMREDAAVFIKRGASYARVLEHGVAFGTTLPDEDPRSHMPNECMPVKLLLKASDIYYKALAELTCARR